MTRSMKTLRPLAAAFLCAGLAMAAQADDGRGDRDGRDGHRMGAHHAAMMGHGGGAMGAPGLFPPRMLDAVGATKEQKDRIGEILSAARGDLDKQREAQRTLHEQMRALLAAPTIDKAAVEALRQKISAARDADSRRMTQAMVDAGNVLSAEQRKQLAERAQQRQDRMEHHRGHRGPQG